VLVQDHVHFCAAKVATRLVPAFLLLFAALSVGHCADIEVPKAAASQLSTSVSVDHMDQWYWQCCKRTGLWMVADPQPLCQLGEELDCSGPQVETNSRDRDGLRRDTWYFLGYQAAAIGILYMMPESVSSWSDEQKEEYSLSVWWDNVTHPAWDTDDDYINYVIHPYWGAAYFVRARERGYDNRQAFWYSVLLSSTYEFGAEALFEQPSIQDLIITPVLGSLLGKYFMRVRGDIRERSAIRGHRTTKEKWAWVLTDPLGSLNSQFDKWFGWESHLQIRPYGQFHLPAGNSSADKFRREKDRVVGLQFYLQW
jgi:hypothetical protein